MHAGEGPAPKVRDRARGSLATDAFAASLVGRSPHTRSAYEHDVAEFVAWAERGGCAGGPAALDHRTLRRYPRLPRHPRLRPHHDRPQGRRAPRLPALPPPPRRDRARPRRAPARPEGRQPPAPGHPHRRGRRPARRRRRRRRPRRRPRTATTPSPARSCCATSPCSRCSTAPGSGSPSAAGCASPTATSTAASSPCSARAPRCDGSRSARPRSTRVAAWLDRGRPALATARHRRPTSVFLNRRGRALTPRDARRVLERHPLPDGRAAPPARAAPRLRYAPARRRSRPPGSAGAPRPRRSGDHPDLHPRDPRPAPRRLRSDPPPCLTIPPKRSTSSGPTTSPTAPRTRASG